MNHGHSKEYIVDCEYRWTIPDFSVFYELCKLETKIESPTFSLGDHDELTWFLSFYPKGKYKPQFNQSPIYLYLKSYKCNLTEKVCANIRYGILLSPARKGKTCMLNWEFRVGDMKCSPACYVPLQTMRNATRNCFSPDTLIITCKISLLADQINFCGQSNTVVFKHPEQRLPEDFERVLESQNFSDVTLLAVGKEFRAHKVILAGRSSVFKAMFEHDMEEQRSNRVLITDVDHDVMQEMLRFIYTGKASNLKKVADRLLIAANKYALEGLKVICEEVLYDNLDIRNAVKILILADMHNADQLKAGAVAYINKNAKIITTAAWKDMIKTHPHLIHETFSAAVNY